MKICKNELVEHSKMVIDGGYASTHVFALNKNNTCTAPHIDPVLPCYCPGRVLSLRHLQRTSQIPALVGQSHAWNMGGAGGSCFCHHTGGKDSVQAHSRYLRAAPIVIAVMVIFRTNSTH